MKKLILILFFASLTQMYSQQSGDSTSAHPKNLTVLQFKERTLRPDKLVLVNLQADWCVVCKKEKGILEQIAKDYAQQVEIIEVDLDDNPLIAEYFEVDGLPVNLLYKTGNLIWNRMGLIDKTQVESLIRAGSK